MRKRPFSRVLLAGLALVLAARTPDLNISMKIVLAFLVFVAVVGNWLRWYKTR